MCSLKFSNSERFVAFTARNNQLGVGAPDHLVNRVLVAKQCALRLEVLCAYNCARLVT